MGGSGLPQLGFPRRCLIGWMNGFTMPQMILRPADFAQKAESLGSS